MQAGKKHHVNLRKSVTKRKKNLYKEENRIFYYFPNFKVKNFILKSCVFSATRKIAVWILVLILHWGFLGKRHVCILRITSSMEHESMEFRTSPSLFPVVTRNWLSIPSRPWISDSSMQGLWSVFAASSLPKSWPVPSTCFSSSLISIVYY